MVFVPRFLRPASLLPAALILFAVGAAGCADKHIGRACEVLPGVTPQPGPSNMAVINSAALECPSRICLIPSAQNMVKDTGATCTDECSDDGDCDDAEKRGSDPSDRRCTSSFFCRVATNIGGYACRKLCLCGDFVNTSEAPGACKPLP